MTAATTVQSEVEIFVTMIGGVPFATPTPKPTLTPKQLHRIEAAFVAIDEGRVGAAELHIRAVERRLWPKGFDPHHVLRLMAASDPERAAQTKLGVRENQYQRTRRERRRASELSAAREPEQTKVIATDLRVMEEAQARLDAFAAGDKAAKRGEKKALLEEIRVRRLRVKAARAAQLDQHWSGHAITESLRLAAARGEDVEEEATEVPEWVRDENGALVKGENDLPVLKVERAKAQRVLTHTGLDLAYIKGDLGDSREEPTRLRNIGRRYREAYEAAAGRTTPESSEIRSTGIPEPQLASLKASEELTVMRKGLTPKQRAVLDHVCGEDLSVGVTARKIGAGVPSVRRALRGGLERAGENLAELAALRKAQREKAAA